MIHSRLENHDSSNNPDNTADSTSLSAEEIDYSSRFRKRGNSEYLGTDEGVSNSQQLNLLNLCKQAKKDGPGSWEDVRDWLREHTAYEAREDALQIGPNGCAALHVACHNSPPTDIVEVLISAAPKTVKLIDDYGWIPLHYACASGASEEVLRILIGKHPESKFQKDSKGRTPLHFALGNAKQPVSAKAAILLASSGADDLPDCNGMLPIHYACAYGANEDVLHVLTDDSDDKVLAKDNMGRTPLHFAMGNCDRADSPAVVKLLLDKNPEVINVEEDENQQLPIHLLANRAQNFALEDCTKMELEEKKKNALTCLDLFLNTRPKPTANFLTALQTFPEWLSDHTVVSPVLQELLNQKISQRFPTAIMMLDLYALLAIIATYSYTVLFSIETSDGETNGSVAFINLLPMYVGAMYFFIREIVQLLSCLYLGILSTWVSDMTNWLDVVFIFFVFFWAFVINIGTMDLESFRTGTAVSLFIMWMKFLNFLTSLLVEFAVFVSGVLHVVRGFGPFITALIIILVAFMQMFYTVFQQPCGCDYLRDLDECDPEEKDYSGVRFCDRWQSFLTVYTMLLGEVDDTYFIGNNLAVILFSIFMFLVVILLANVLIAIVTDSYGVIRNERAEIVFWSTRLDFVAEMDAISNGPWKKKVKNALMIGEESETNGVEEESDITEELWKKLMDLYEEDISNVGVSTIEFWCYVFVRFMTTFVIIPIWLLGGFLSAGWLWPPQIRAHILQQKITRKSLKEVINMEGTVDEIVRLKMEMEDLREEMSLNLSSERKRVKSTTSKVNSMREELHSEMKEIKQIMTFLFEMQTQVSMTNEV